MANQLYESGHLFQCFCTRYLFSYSKLSGISAHWNGGAAGVLRIFRRVWKTGRTYRGYLVGFIFMALIAGFFVDRFQGNRVMQAVGMILGTVVAYIFGTAWLCVQANLSFGAGLAAGVIPYVPGDLIKIAAALVVGPVLRKAVRRAA